MRGFLRALAVLALALAPLPAARAQSVDTTTTGLGLLLMGSGLHTNDWGTQTSTNLQKLENAVTNASTVSTTGGTTNLTLSQASYRELVISGALTSNAVVQVPAVPKDWWILNATSGAYTLTLQLGTSGATVVIPQGTLYRHVLTDGARWFLDGLLLASNNLSDLPNAATARTNLGLGSIATHPTTDFVTSTTTVTAGTGLSGGGALSSNQTISMPNVGTAGTCSFCTVTTDAQGRVTAISTGSTGIASDTGHAGQFLTTDGAGNHTWGTEVFARGAFNLNGTIANPLNLTYRSGGGGSNCFNFGTAASSANYVVLITSVGNADYTSYVYSKTTTGFCETTNYTSTGAAGQINLDIVVFGG